MWCGVCALPTLEGDTNTHTTRTHALLLQGVYLLQVLQAVRIMAGAPLAGLCHGMEEENAVQGLLGSLPPAHLPDELNTLLCQVGVKPASPSSQGLQGHGGHPDGDGSAEVAEVRSAQLRARLLLASCSHYFTSTTSDRQLVHGGRHAPGGRGTDEPHQHHAHHAGVVDADVLSQPPHALTPFTLEILNEEIELCLEDLRVPGAGGTGEDDVNDAGGDEGQPHDLGGLGWLGSVGVAPHLASAISACGAVKATMGGSRGLRTKGGAGSGRLPLSLRDIKPQFQVGVWGVGAGEGGGQICARCRFLDHVAPGGVSCVGPGCGLVARCRWVIISW